MNQIIESLMRLIMQTLGIEPIPAPDAQAYDDDREEGADDDRDDD